VYLKKMKMRRDLMKIYRSSGSSNRVADGGGGEEGYDDGVDLDYAAASTLRKHRRNASRLLRAALEGVITDDATATVLMRGCSLDICRRWSRVTDGSTAGDDDDDDDDDDHAINSMHEDSESLDGSDGVMDGAEWLTPLLIPSIRKQMMTSFQYRIRGSGSRSGSRSRSRSVGDRTNSRPARSKYLDRSVDRMSSRSRHRNDNGSSSVSRLCSGGDDRGVGDFSCSIDYNNNGDVIHIDDDDDDDGDDDGKDRNDLDLSYNDHRNRTSSSHCNSRSTEPPHPPPLRSKNRSSCINDAFRPSSSSSSSSNGLPLPMQMCSVDSMLYDSALSMSFELAPHPEAASDEETLPTMTMRRRRRTMTNLQFCGLIEDDDSYDEEEEEGRGLQGGRSRRSRQSAETMDMFRLIKVSGCIILIF
jgi:hypothetical protein